MEFRLLGPVELWARGVQQPLPSTKLKLLLAALLWDAGQMVPTVTLVRRMWDEDAPPQELASLQAYVSRLRAVLKQCDDAAVRLEHIPFGYRLLVPTESIDYFQYVRERDLARAAADRGSIDEAIRLLRSAEGLVHGEPLAGLPGSWADHKRSELREFTHDVTLLRIKLQLTVRPDDARDLLAELRRLAAERLFDESVLELHMLALHHAGRTSDALHVYGEFRSRLRNHSGLDPRASSQRLYERLLKDEPAPRTGLMTVASPTTSYATTIVPDTLDRDPPGFIGRTADIEAITAEVDDQLAAGLPAVLVIDGMPGIGKTTLGVHLAHRLRQQCPDGVLQLRMRGHDERYGPSSSESALDTLSGMLGATPEEIQRATGLDNAIARWRHYTHGKRLLLLLDDAATAEQILPLIPSSPGCIVLVTARTRLPDLPGAAWHALQPMLDADAVSLFISAARMAHTSDPAVNDVVDACDGYPLALTVAGNTLRMRQSWSIRDYAEDLTAPHVARQLDSVIAPAIYRTVATSYRDLSELERKILRRLSLNPGAQIGLRAVTALADASPSETDHALFHLVGKNLVVEPTRRYYRLHDMMRLFAEHACETDEDPEELDHAAERLALYTLGAVEAATRLFHPHRHARLTEVEDPPDDRYESGFTSAAEATAWLDSEQEWLRVTATHWFANDRGLQAAALSHMLAKYLDRRSLWKEGIALHESSLRVWRELENIAGQAYTSTDLASLHWRLGAVDKTLAHANAALEFWSELNDADGQADALLQVARAQYSNRRFADAISSFERCAALRLTVKDTRGRAVALFHLGNALFDSGEHRTGIKQTLEALALARGIQDESVESYCVNNLGEYYARLGDFAAAETYYQEALPLVQKFGESYSLGVVVANLGDTQTRLNQPAAALPLLDRAMDIFQAAENDNGRLLALTAQARAHHALHRENSARVLLDQASELAERLGDPWKTSNVCLINGDIYSTQGDHGAATLAYTQALRYAGEAGSELLQGVACHRLGDNAEVNGDLSKACSYWRRSISLYGDGFTSEVADLRGRVATAETA